MARKKPSAPATPQHGDATLEEVVASKASTASEKGASTAPPSAAATAASLLVLPPVKINNYNLTELKNTCDDYVKKLLSQPNFFQQNHKHTDIRLALGYLSIFIAGGTALYGWKADFEKSKPIVTVGVILYFLLSSMQALYIYFVERNIVFEGKRKTLAGRIETERLVVSSKTIKSTPASPPQYSLELSYKHTANGGKALLKRGGKTAHKGYNTFFDERGNIIPEVFASWVEGLVTTATSP